MLYQFEQAENLYDTLFDWQPPSLLWQRSQALKTLFEKQSPRFLAMQGIDSKKILEGWVIGRTLTMAYHGEQCLVHVARTPSMDGQIYRNRRINSIEVTQALYPGRTRSILVNTKETYAAITPQEYESYSLYRDDFIAQAFRQIDKRIEHKFQLYKDLDYLLVHIDLFDVRNPRYSHFALQEFYEQYGNDLECRLRQRYRTHWQNKIRHLFLLSDKTTGFVTYFTSQAEASLLDFTE